MPLIPQLQSSQSMNPSPLPPAFHPPARRLWLWGILAAPLLLLVVLAVGVASCFRLSSDARALRNGLIKSSGVEWRQQIALNAGNLTLGIVRAGLSRARLDPGVRAVLQAVRGAEAGVYRLPSGAKSPERAAMFDAADTTMTARGWDRVVGVMDGRNLVTVYMSGKNVSSPRMKCCVMVFDGSEMVLVSAQANLEPLVEYALNQPALRAKAHLLTQR
ncbi:MAG: hypothetical protein ABSH15_12510 [Verrucomicrobiota bacterium]